MTRELRGSRAAAVSAARRAVAAVTGVSAVAGSLGVFELGLAPGARAAAAPGQAVNNDWGQTAAQVQAEIDAVVDADSRVVAARTRYLRALSSYATLKQVEKSAVANYDKAKLTSGTADDAAASKALATIRAQVYQAACEVVASQLAMTKIVSAVSSAARSHHYIKAPYVALPATPDGLQAVGQSGQVAVSWGDVAGASSYKVFRDGVQVATTMLPAYLDSGLDNGTAYEYYVIATNIAGWSPRSLAVVGVPTPTAPTAPTALVATPGDASVSLTWDGSPNATGYQVYRDGALVGTTAAPAFVDSGLVNATPYSYTVVALNGAVVSPPSASVTSTPVATSPAAPTGLVAAPGDGQVALSWTAVQGATAYTVYRNGVAAGTTVVPSFLDTALTNGTTYAYSVVAVRQNSTPSAPSATVSSTPVAPPLPTPTGLAATPGDGSVGLTWTAVTGATSYRVYRDGVLVASPSVPTLTDTGLVNGNSYSYTVVALSATSLSAASSAVTATPAAAAPGAPTGLTGQAGDTTATLSWTAVSGATSYVVYRGGVSLATVTGTTYTNTGLTNGTAYTYSVTAVKAGVESAHSSSVTVTPVAVVPGVPSGLVAAPGDGQVALSWTASPNASSYRVYRGGVLVGSPTGTSFTDTGLTDGTTYSYTVTAVNGTAVSAASTAVTSTPMAPAPATPTGLAGTAGNGQVFLSWNPSPTATSYRVYRNGSLLASPTATSYTDTGLTNGTSYSYYVVAVAATTPSAASTTISVTPVKPPVNGTFTGATAAIANGHGTLHVVIVVSNSAITSATGTLLTNDGTETISINNNAIPQYNSKTVAAQSASITKVTGATLTWSAYKTSLQSALTQAGL